MLASLVGAAHPLLLFILLPSQHYCHFAGQRRDSPMLPLLLLLLLSPCLMLLQSLAGQLGE
jgi:hypothetical protein